MDDVERRVHDIELARWQGMIDERTAKSVGRLDEINGDVREIKQTLTQMRDDLAASDKAREEWMPVLKKLATSEAVQEGVAEILSAKRKAGLTSWQKYAAGAGIVGIFVNLALRLLGVDAIL